MCAYAAFVYLSVASFNSLYDRVTLRVNSDIMKVVNEMKTVNSLLGNVFACGCIRSVQIFR